ncbi:MAG: TetR/AcrR family transcriptional regulator [Myxococcota bacterium]|nr:TetR/AcrR family transcriptional regulator [Myxococcota bacterium]
MIHSSADSPSRIERRRAARTDELVEATLELVLEEGLAGLTVQRLASRMDWSVGALYRYFPGKDALLAETQRRVLTKLHQDILDDVAAIGMADEPLAGVLSITRRFRRFALEEPARFHLVSAVLADPRPLVSNEYVGQVAEVLRSLLATVDQQLEGAALAGQLDVGDASKRTVLLWAGLHGLLQFAKLGRLEARLRQTTVLAETLADDLLRSWGASPEALAEAHLLLLEL